MSPKKSAWSLSEKKLREPQICVDQRPSVIKVFVVAFSKKKSAVLECHNLIEDISFVKFKLQTRSPVKSKFSKNLIIQFMATC